MSDFEYLFAFYSLLLGLALANVATGLADIWRSRAEAPIGICTPLLALVIISYAASQWFVMWLNREELIVGPAPLLIMLGTLLPYIFISQAMFPKKVEAWGTLDQYYLANTGALLGAIMFATAIAVTANAIAFEDIGTDPIVRTLLAIVAPAVALRFPNRWFHAAVLLAISLYYLAQRLFSLVY